MIGQAILYLATHEDAHAALLPVAGHPLALRALMGAVRAGVRRVGVPAIFRGTELERAIARTPAARAATVWLEAHSDPPAEPTLLVPAAAVVRAPALAALVASTPTAVLAESRSGDAPVVAVAPAAARSLWKRLVVGEPVDVPFDGGPHTRDVSGGGRDSYARVTTPQAASRAETLLYEDLGSPIDTRLDTLLHRRLSRPLTRLAVATGLSPNVLTLVTLLVGLAAVWCFWRGGIGSALGGLLLYGISVVFDHTDGEVARLTLAESTLGEWLDLFVDTLVHALIVVALGMSAERLSGGGAAVLGAVAAMGVLASAAVAKMRPVPTTTAGFGRVLHGLSNRNGFYGLLVIFTLAQAAVPMLLPLFMIVVAVGMHAFWLSALAYRVTRRPGTASRRGGGVVTGTRG